MSLIFHIFINELLLTFIQYDTHGKEFSPTQTDLIFGDLSKRAVPDPSNTEELTLLKNERDSSPFQNLRKPLTCPFYGNHICVYLKLSTFKKRVRANALLSYL